MAQRAKAPKCHACGGVMKRQSIKRTIKVGSRKVTDGGTMMGLVCTKCGGYDLSHKALLKLERKAALVVLSDAESIDGSVLRYARKALGLTQVELAHALDAAPETVSRWETGDLSIDRTTQLAVAQLLTMTERDPESFERLVDSGGATAPISRTG